MTDKRQKVRDYIRGVLREGAVLTCVIDAVYQPPTLIAYWYPQGLSTYKIIYGS